YGATAAGIQSDAEQVHPAHTWELHCAIIFGLFDDEHSFRADWDGGIPERCGLNPQRIERSKPAEVPADPGERFGNRQQILRLNGKPNGKPRMGFIPIHGSKESLDNPGHHRSPPSS